MGILVSLAVLSALIIFHEWGHFLAARFFGVKVEEFGLGMPILVTKPLWKKRWGDTTYAFYPMLLGGFVRMKGQDDFDLSKKSDDPDSYMSKKPWQKIVILLAGPFANILLAFLLYIAIAAIGAEALAPSVGATIKDSPAAEAGIKPKDRIVAINGQKVTIWDDIGKIITRSEGPLQITLLRKSKRVDLVMTPRVSEARSIFGEKIRKKMIGIAPSGEFVKIPMHSLSDILSYAWEKTVWATGIIIRSLEKLIEGIIPADQMGGIVSIVQVTSQASAIGITTLFALAALISVNLGVLNLLPIPALDGGHIVFNLYEMIFKRPPSEKVFYNLTVAGWVLLLSLMAFTTYNDIIRIMRG